MSFKLGPTLIIIIYVFILPKIWGHSSVMLHSKGRVSDLSEKNVTKMYSVTLLALQGGGCQISRKKRYVTPEWPLQ